MVRQDPDNFCQTCERYGLSDGFCLGCNLTQQDCVCQSIMDDDFIEET